MNNIMEKIEALANDQDFVAKISNTGSNEELLAVMAEYGVQMAEEDLKAFQEQVMMAPVNGEMDEEMLDNVSGGSLWGWLKSLFERNRKKNVKKMQDLCNMV